tara:strand:+ start:5400 stop:6371 length:972 start_codon:yes stop_codon:yes gene_type:complete
MFAAEGRSYPHSKDWPPGQEKIGRNTLLNWTCELKLDSDRRLVSGSEQALANAIRNGSDLRIRTEFVHNEHIDINSDSTERVREVAEFGVTYLIEDRWVAGIMNLRQPVALPDGFGPRPSMSFFLYNQDGNQAIARPHLDGVPTTGTVGTSTPQDHVDMPKFHQIDAWDGETNAPSTNFVYDFEEFEYYVCNSWEEVLSHDADGCVQSGSIDDLGAAFSDGCAVKIAVRGLCSDLNEAEVLDHEVFIEIGSCYYYLDRKLFIGGSHPVARVAPGIPMVYRSNEWDFGWLVSRTDGHVVYRRCDPYSLAFADRESRHAIRWFVR